MRNITKIVIHCAYTRPDMDVGAAEIRRWHVDPPPKGNGWADIGYHFVIRRDGTLEIGRPLARAGAHVTNHNANSIGICLVGGMRQDGRGAESNYTQKQWDALEGLVKDLVQRFPNARVLGHSDLANRACPVFDVAAWWADLRNCGRLEA